jgi:hypothetical protein
MLNCASPDNGAPPQSEAVGANAAAKEASAGDKCKRCMLYIKRAASDKASMHVDNLKGL